MKSALSKCAIWKVCIIKFYFVTKAFYSGRWNWETRLEFILWNIFCCIRISYKSYFPRCSSATAWPDTKGRFWAFVAPIYFNVLVALAKNQWFINPYWQILENSSRIFSETSVFRGPIVSGKLIHKSFMSTYSAFAKYQGTSQTDFWKIHPYLD